MSTDTDPTRSSRRRVQKPSTDFVNIAWYRLRWHWLRRRTVAWARYARCTLWIWREADGVFFGNWGVAVFADDGREWVSFHHAWLASRAQWKAVEGAMYFRDGVWPELP